MLCKWSKKVMISILTTMMVFGSMPEMSLNLQLGRINLIRSPCFSHEKIPSGNST